MGQSHKSYAAPSRDLSNYKIPFVNNSVYINFYCDSKLELVTRFCNAVQYSNNIVKLHPFSKILPFSVVVVVGQCQMTSPNALTEIKLAIFILFTWYPILNHDDTPSSIRMVPHPQSR